MSTAPAPDPDADRAIEYYTSEVHAPLEPEDLEPLGRQGWRLAAVVKHRFILVYYFMRPARGAGPEAGGKSLYENHSYMLISQGFSSVCPFGGHPRSTPP
jgi:hypothetical protein